MPRPNPKPLDRRANRPHGATRYVDTQSAQVAPRSSRSRHDFYPYSTAIGGNWTSITSRASAVAPQILAVPVPIPADAYGVICIVSMTALTATAGTANFAAYSNGADSGGVGSGGVGALSCPMTTSGHVFRTQMVLPIVNGGISFEVSISGTVQYSMLIFFCGFLRR